jgi:hypothetical protein
MEAFYRVSKIIVWSVFFITTLTLFSCAKEGGGGKSVIKGHVNNQAKLIPNAVVYIKYGAPEFPGSDITLYDDHVTADANANYEFRDLRKGSYYLYGVGFDRSLSREIRGGIGVKLNFNKILKNDVPLSEE